MTPDLPGVPGSRPATTLLGARLAIGWAELGELVIAADGVQHGSLRWEGPVHARGEIGEEGWTVTGLGLRPFQVTVGPRGWLVPDLAYVGTLVRGLVRSRRGHAYQLGRGWEVGNATAWLLHESGASVLEMELSWNRKLEPLLIATVAQRIPEPADLHALLLLVGFLEMARYRCPWIVWTTFGVTNRAVERTMESLLRTFP